MDREHIEAALARHQRVGFQLSGGRDSVAALYVMRPWWDRLTVYHLDTQDHFPETAAVISTIEQDVPVERITGDAPGVRAVFGLPSDLVPVDNMHPWGRAVSGNPVRIQGRYECCYRSLMLPMHERMLADGITLIVRGQRDADYAAPPTRSGTVEGGVEALYPIQDWTTVQVDTYLSENALPIAGFYAGGMPHGSDCMGCTAWWGEKRAAYLESNHPKAFETYTRHIAIVRREIERQFHTIEENHHG